MRKIYYRVINAFKKNLANPQPKLIIQRLHLCNMHMYVINDLNDTTDICYLYIYHNFVLFIEYNKQANPFLEQ